MKKVLSTTERANLVHACVTLKDVEEKICLRDYKVRKKSFILRKDLEELIQSLEVLKKD